MSQTGTRHTFHFPSDTNTQHFREECEKLGAELKPERVIFVVYEGDDARVIEAAKDLGAIHHAEE